MFLQLSEEFSPAYVRFYVMSMNFCGRKVVEANTYLSRLKGALFGIVSTTHDSDLVEMTVRSYHFNFFQELICNRNAVGEGDGDDCAGWVFQVDADRRPAWVSLEDFT